MNQDEPRRWALSISDRMSVGAAVSFVILLTGCAAGDAVINHGSVDVQTHMSETVFLDPVPPNLKTVYVSARNTSDHPEVDVRGQLMQSITERGYQVVQDPMQAHYMLRINVLQAGKIDPKSKDGLLSAKYGEPLLGGAVAAGATSLVTSNSAAIGGVGLAVGLGTFAANALYKDVTYTVVIDIQLSERPLNGSKVQTTTTTSNSQRNGTHSSKTAGIGTGAAKTTQTDYSATDNSRNVGQNIVEEKDFKQYQIREVAYADKVNLKLEEATPMLVTRLASTLSNLFD
jgi:hypothetical protein